MTAHEEFEQDLPLYALGALTASESDSIEAHLRECPPCRRELQLLQGDFAALALSVPSAEVSERTRERFLQSISREARPLVQRKSRWMLLPFVLSAVLAIFAALLWRDNRSLAGRLAESQQQRQADAASVENAQQLLAVLTAPDARRLTLVAAKSKPQPQAKAIYVPRMGSLVFMANNLAALPKHKSYEIWIMPSSGDTPMAAGMFQPDATGSAIMIMPSLPKGMDVKAFAVTVEPETGSAKPTLPMVLISTGE